MCPSAKATSPVTPRRGIPDPGAVTPDERDPRAALARALARARIEARPPRPPLARTTHRTLTRRGVLWLGQTCNLKCYFCYFLNRIAAKDHPEHAFMSLEKARAICDTLAGVYGNTAIDIQGGEPTIWKPILELVRHCRAIGLIPTLITNALVLDRLSVCRAYRDAGVRDFLVSVQGLGAVQDQVVQRARAHERQMRALRNLQEVGIPFRFNCVLSKPAVRQLPQIAELAVTTGAVVVNFIAFNPFEDQAQGLTRSSANVPRYRDVEPFLVEALDLLAGAGVEANVRYYPLCMVPERHRRVMYNFQQLPYDHHEWDFASWSWTGQQPQRMRDGPPTPPAPLSGQGAAWRLRRPAQALASRLPLMGRVLPLAHSLVGRAADCVQPKERLYRQNARVRARLHCRYVQGRACARCDLRRICDGFHGDYAELFGTEEAAAVRVGRLIDAPTHYIARQQKVVEPEDEAWALPPGARG